MELLIYDASLMRKGVVENHSSLIWRRKYYEPGEFELHVPLTSNNINLLTKGSIISKKGSKEVGVVESIQYVEGSETCTMIVTGRFMASYLSRRLIKSTFSFNGKVEDAMRELVNYVTPIPLLELGKINNFNETVTFQATMKELLTIIVKLSKSSGIGFRLIPDFSSKKIIFETYKGVDRSFAQRDNPRVVFSANYNNLNQVTYSWNNQLEKTFAVVGGEGEGSERVYVEIGGGEGLDLKEVFVDAKDIRSDKFETNEEYLNALRQRGYDSLIKKQISESIEYETLPNGNFKYKVDYDLGDIVTIKKSEWGINDHVRITEIEEIYENGGMTVVPTLGNALPDTVDWSD